jgi:hypothetical protein
MYRITMCAVAALFISNQAGRKGTGLGKGMGP